MLKLQKCRCTRQGLEFLKNIISYKEADAEAAFKKLLIHRWYLTEETVAFAF